MLRIINNIKCLLGLHSYVIKGREYWFNQGAPVEDFPRIIKICYECSICGKKEKKIIHPRNRDEYLEIRNK